MNEKRIREVIEVEQKALEMVAQANRESEQIPVRAEAEASAIIEKARGAALAEARLLVEEAKQGDEAAGIISQMHERLSQTASLADRNFEKAVTYVVERVLGKA